MTATTINHIHLYWELAGDYLATATEFIARISLIK
jgi:hypothetical protein